MYVPMCVVCVSVSVCVLFCCSVIYGFLAGGIRGLGVDWVEEGLWQIPATYCVCGLVMIMVMSHLPALFTESNLLEMSKLLIVER